MSKIFVVGMGPSLGHIDVDSLIGSPTIAAGRIHLLYDDTEWRPDMWVCTDRKLNPEVDKDVKVHLDEGIECWVAGDIAFEELQHRPWEGEEGWFWWKYPNANIILPCTHWLKFLPDSWHLPHVCTFGGSGMSAIQIAVKKGYSEIYLLGFDGEYEEGNLHVIDEYETEEWDEYFISQQNKKLEIAQQILEEEADKMDLHIQKVETQKELEKILNGS